MNCARDPDVKENEICYKTADTRTGKKPFPKRKREMVLWFARHGRALTGESPEHAWATRKCIAEQQGCPS